MTGHSSVRFNGLIFFKKIVIMRSALDYSASAHPFTAFRTDRRVGKSRAEPLVQASEYFPRSLMPGNALK